MNLRLSYRLKFSLSIIIILLAFGLLLSLIIGTIAAQALLKENQKRGIAHALNLQARMVEPLLARDFLQSKNLVDALMQADKDISYSFVLDKDGKPLASTFSGGFPVDLGQANPVADQQEYHLCLLKTGSELIYDIAAPIIVSRNRLGTVRIGMSRSQVQDVIKRFLWSIFMAMGLGLVAAALVGNALAFAVTRKLKALHHAAQEIIKGNLDVKVAQVPSRHCWEIKNCPHKECTAYGDAQHRCWHLQDTSCPTCNEGNYSDKVRACHRCIAYKSISGDEIQDLSEFFDVMVLTLRDRLQALESSEERYRLLVSNVPAVVFTGYADWTVEFYDYKIEKMLGYSKDQFTAGKLKWVDVILEEDRARTRKIFIDALWADKSYVREYRVKTKDNKIIWVQEISRIICDRDGKIQHVSGVFFDITDHKRAEEALQQSHAELEIRVKERTAELMEVNNSLRAEIAERMRVEEDLRSERDHSASIINGTPAIVVGITPDGCITFINPAGERITGYRSLELVGRNYWKVFYPEEEYRQLPLLLNDLEQGEVRDYEMVLYSRGGSQRTIAWNSIRRFDDTGKLIEIIGFGNDITDRKYSEAALRASEDRLRTIMATIQTGVLIIDPRTWEIVDANPWALKMISGQADDIVCHDYHKFLGVTELTRSQMSELGQAVDQDDCLLKTIKGETLHVRRSTAKSKIKDQEYFVQSLLDITDMKHLLEKQEINIELAKNIVRLVNGAPPRYIAVSEGIELFVQVISMPCNAEGGDHYLVRNFPPDAQNKQGKTIISLKDQSGHEVSCVLKSIITDLMHNAILHNYSNLLLEETIAKLNEEICYADIFDPEDFITAINVEIDHATLKMRYLSNGHPPFLLIRGNRIIDLPESAEGGINLPLGLNGGIEYSAGEYQLEVGDKLIFYTDGLSEMPLKNCRKTMTFMELGGLVGGIILQKALSPVSEIMTGLLTSIAEISNEEVIPYIKNTSTDDITILGVEIENHNNYFQEIWQPRDADEVEGLVGELYARLKLEWDQHGYASPELRLPLVLEEAIFNAWRHGNKENPEKSIIVRWRYGNDCRLEVIDAGQGFDYARLPDPTASERLMEPGGRGLFIIRHFAGQVKWQQGGSHLIIIFTKHSTTPEKKFWRQTEKLMQLWTRADIL